MKRAQLAIYEWRDKRYQHMRWFSGSIEDAKAEVARLNEGYSGPRYVVRTAVRELYARR